MEAGMSASLTRAAATSLLAERLTREVVGSNLGQCQQALGLIGSARNSFTQARQLNPQCTEAKLGLHDLSRSGLFSRLRGWWRRLPWR